MSDLLLWCIVWILAAGFVLYRRWLNGQTAGLMLGYIVSFGAIHWLASALYLLPMHVGVDPIYTTNGMRISGIAMVAFAVGVELSSFLLTRRNGAADADLGLGDGTMPVRAIETYLWIGAFMHLVLFPAARGIPSVAALVATGSTLVVMGISMRCWNAWHTEDFNALWLWLASTASFPLFTVVTQGFLGYGMAAMLTVLTFVAAFSRTRWHILVFACILGYVGLSIYVTYMRDRSEIREMVWGGSALSARFDRLSNTVAEWEWFDITNDDHRYRLDERLNQNMLVGAAVLYLDKGQHPFARGQTLIDAAWSIVPRAVWPDKPMSAGSGNLVSTYTGIPFAEGTSVGVGQVMELYINFGLMSIVVGFVIIGGVLAYLDETAVLALRHGDVRTFVLVFLPGLSLLNVGGSFVESTSTAAAGLAVATMVNRFVAPPPRVEEDGDSLETSPSNEGAGI